MTHYVYRLFDDGECLYVGMSVNVSGRLEQHRARSSFGHRITDVVTTGHADEVTAARVELEQIRELRPRYNIAGRRVRSQWSACDYFEVIERMVLQPEGRASNSPALRNVILQFRRAFPEIAEATLPSLGYVVKAVA